VINPAIFAEVTPCPNDKVLIPAKRIISMILVTDVRACKILHFSGKFDFGAKYDTHIKKKINL
jgi:hypothetical protein